MSFTSTVVGHLSSGNGGTPISSECLTLRAVAAAPTSKRTWGNVLLAVQCDRRAGEVVLKKSWKKVSTIDQCKKSCEDTTGCQSITLFEDGWCAHFSTPCTRTKRSKKTVAVQLLAEALDLNKKTAAVQLLAEALNLDENAAMVEQDIEQRTDLSALQGVDDMWWILVIVYLFNVFMF